MEFRNQRLRRLDQDHCSSRSQVPFVVKKMQRPFYQGGDNFSLPKISTHHESRDVLKGKPSGYVTIQINPLSILSKKRDKPSTKREQHNISMVNQAVAQSLKSQKVRQESLLRHERGQLNEITDYLSNSKVNQQRMERSLTQGSHNSTTFLAQKSGFVDSSMRNLSQRDNSGIETGKDMSLSGILNRKQHKQRTNFQRKGYNYFYTKSNHQRQLNDHSISKKLDDLQERQLELALPVQLELTSSKLQQELKEGIQKYLVNKTWEKWVQYEKDWKQLKTDHAAKIPLPCNMTLLVPHLCFLLTSKGQCPITDKTLRKAKRIAHFRYHPDRHPTVKKTDPLVFNQLCEISKEISNAYNSMQINGN